MNTAKKHAAHGFTQFELTTETVTKLNGFNLTPTAKLVLLYLTTCYNPKHKEVFPKQKTIADKLGISERSVTRAIQELFKEGLVLIECKYTNRYKFTSKIVSEGVNEVSRLDLLTTPPIEKCAENLSADLRQNDTQESDNLSEHNIEQKKETKKEPSNKGGNVYSDSFTPDDEILQDYAIKHSAKNVKAYVNTLKSTGSAAKIIKEYKQKQWIAKRAQLAAIETRALIQQWQEDKKTSVLPETCEAWVNFGKKAKIK